MTHSVADRSYVHPVLRHFPSMRRTAPQSLQCVANDGHRNHDSSSWHEPSGVNGGHAVLGLGLEAQRAAILAEVERRNLDLVEIYEDAWIAQGPSTGPDSEPFWMHFTAGEGDVGDELVFRVGSSPPSWPQSARLSEISQSFAGLARHWPAWRGVTFESDRGTRDVCREATRMSPWMGPRWSASPS